MTKTGGRGQISAASVWTLAVDTMAKASAVAAAATGAELAGIAAKRLRCG